MDENAEVQNRLSRQALMIMLAIILFPPMAYSASLMTNPSTTPDEVIMAISVGVFGCVIYLWILDSTSILVFREEWMSKSIYGAAIASIIGTSVGVYSGYFAGDKYPMRGNWELSLTAKVGMGISDKTSEFDLLIGFNENALTYQGYSDSVPLYEITDSANRTDVVYEHFEVIDLDVERKLLIAKLSPIELYNSNLEFGIDIDREETLVTGSAQINIGDNPVTFDLRMMRQ